MGGDSVELELIPASPQLRGISEPSQSPGTFYKTLPALLQAPTSPFSWRATSRTCVGPQAPVGFLTVGC